MRKQFFENTTSLIISSKKKKLIYTCTSGEKKLYTYNTFYITWTK